MTGSPAESEMARVSKQAIDRQRVRNKEWMRRYRATERGHVATSMAKRKIYSTQRGKAVKQEGNRRWKHTERGKSAARRYANNAYPRVKHKQLARRMMRIYGLSVAEYESLLVSQKNQCLICGNEMVRPHIDHCHSTGKVRGLLCMSCNTGLGMFRDDITLLLKAMAYLNNAK